jgi:hypothetical protein
VNRMPWDHPKEGSAKLVAAPGEDLAKLAQDDEAPTGEQASRQYASLGVSPDAPGEATAEARLVPHHLLIQLRSYPRMRNLVLAFLVVQERYDWAARMRSRLQRAGPEPEPDFWENLQGDFGGMGLRSDFPTRLLNGEDAIPEFAQLVDDFDDRYTKVATAAEAALNPSQSAQSFTEALEQVSAMRVGAIQLARRCKELARSLLEDLDETVNMIFAGEARPSGFEDRDKASGSPEVESTAFGPTGRDDERRGDKHLLGAGGAADVRGHLLIRPKEGT